ncbi:hypothetical protein [Halosolutus halophilus]|uniref:hypothetical protein n=1 Tax=Halosolutus halophilus TaxID=1552990 RepID=UPI002235010C|nr:hypothetical protein [Halosolutus halophilus]
MWPALVSSEFLAVLAMLVLLVGVPIFVVAALAIVSGVLQSDIDRRIAERTDADDDDPETIEDRG